MAGVTPDSSEGGVGSSIGDPYEPLQSQLREMRTVLGFLFDNPDEVISDIFEDVLAMPPKERFRNAQVVFERRMNEKVGDKETIRALLPRITSDQVKEFLDQALERLIRETLAPLLTVRDGEEFVVLSAGYSAIRSSLSAQEDESVDEGRVFSAMFAFLARLYDVGTREEDDPVDEHQIIMDTGRLIYNIDVAMGEPTMPDPDAADFDTVRREVLEFGAAVAYASLDISIGRGAELAGVSRPEFEEILERYGVKPRYGPSSVEELYENTNGSFAGE